MGAPTLHIFWVTVIGGTPNHITNNYRCFNKIRATSHTRLRAQNYHYTSSTLIGGEGGAGPSSLHNMLEGPMEYVDARWM